jgi:hypothetical protein
MCLTEVLTEIRVSKQSGLGMGEAEQGRSNTPMDMLMEMMMTVRIIAE